MDVDIGRWYTPRGTFGILTMPEFSCLTVERPPENNKPFVSCIPEGQYICRRVQSPKFGETFEVMDVQGRTLIRFHWGSFPTDYQGCIGTGREFLNTWGLSYTRDTFAQFMKSLKGVNEFYLTIRQIEPEGMKL